MTVESEPLVCFTASSSFPNTVSHDSLESLVLLWSIKGEFLHQATTDLLDLIDVVRGEVDIDNSHIPHLVVDVQIEDKVFLHALVAEVEFLPQGWFPKSIGSSIKHSNLSSLEHPKYKVYCPSCCRFAAYPGKLRIRSSLVLLGDEAGVARSPEEDLPSLVLVDDNGD